MGRVETPSRESLETERAFIVQTVGRSEAALRSDAVSGALAGDEWRALERLDAIAFLLGETDNVSG